MEDFKFAYHKFYPIEVKSEMCCSIHSVPPVRLANCRNLLPITSNLKKGKIPIFIYSVIINTARYRLP